MAGKPKVIDSRLKIRELFGPLGKPTTLVVHHGESVRDHDDHDALRILRGYNELHAGAGDHDDWGGIGYHFAVTTAGTLVKCRPVAWKGAHSPPNAGKIGVVLIGSYGRDRPSQAQIDTLRWLFHHGRSVGVPAGLTLKGHRDLNSTSCPGDYLYAQLLKVRRPDPKPKPGGIVPRWFHDPKKVRRVQRHLDWAYRHYKIAPKHPVSEDGKLGPHTKEAIKDWKFLLGYLRPFQTWATGVNQEFIDRLHFPSRAGKLAQARGVKRRNERRRPKTGRAALARQVIDHPNAQFGYVSPTGGSARVGLEQTAKGEKAYVASPEAADTGRHVWIDTRILNFLLDLCDEAPVQITCVVNGDHSSDSQHYTGQAVDIGKPAPGAIGAVASRNGVVAFNEDSAHFHCHV